MNERADSFHQNAERTSVSAFSRRDKERSRDRRADRRGTAHGDEHARIATREREDIIPSQGCGGIIPHTKLTLARRGRVEYN